MAKPVKASSESRKRPLPTVFEAGGGQKTRSKDCMTLEQFGGPTLTEHSLPQLLAKGISREVCEVSSSNASSFKFFPEACSQGSQQEPTRSRGWQEIWTDLILSIGNADLCKKEWVRNGYRWVVWKLAAMERRFPDACGNKWLTYERVLAELTARYRKEVVAAQRSCVRKVLEKDENPGNFMVLCICAVSQPTTGMAHSSGICEFVNL